MDHFPTAGKQNSSEGCMLASAEDIQVYLLIRVGLFYSEDVRCHEVFPVSEFRVFWYIEAMKWPANRTYCLQLKTYA